MYIKSQNTIKKKKLKCISFIPYICINTNVFLIIRHDNAQLKFKGIEHTRRILCIYIYIYLRE